MILCDLHIIFFFGIAVFTEKIINFGRKMRIRGPIRGYTRTKTLNINTLISLI